MPTERVEAVEAHTTPMIVAAATCSGVVVVRRPTSSPVAVGRFGGSLSVEIWHQHEIRAIGEPEARG
ncbi:MAG: hypothetical protein IPG46_08260 [Actinobacteria bacterium]|nr:hypothetical protein [Actinomycetota bacterium]